MKRNEEGYSYYLCKAQDPDGSLELCDICREKEKGCKAYLDSLEVVNKT